MMHFRYFSIPLVPNGGLKIGYFGLFSKFFFADFIVYLPKLTLKREPFALNISYIIIQL